MTGPSSDVVVAGALPPAAVRVNWGRWIADCPSCPSAVAVDEHHQTRLGATAVDDGTPVWVEGCWDCGATTTLIWPAAPMVAGIERLLAMRPDPNTRNWTPGETLHDLVRENALHGLFSDPSIDALAALLPDPELLVVDDDRIVLDYLPAGPLVPALPAGPSRTEIGA